MIHFNTIEGSDERQKTEPLTLQEEEKVIDILNKGYFTLEEEKIIQQFVNHYQNLSLHKATTVGLWATDRKELINSDKFFEIKF